MKKIATLLATVLALGLVGCNTVKGFGQDVQKAGEKLEGAAKK
ncbi:putative small secreted protein [Rhodoferax ferrireducens]|uniref:Small secreted protein n=1 Tax=Rhodoferax ferrireducens TaxID=192843 RepID=A0ABU2C2R4_9BURK|nr:entericidin A/B family lipoprotein [Rhodoferax ferrireducens]MDR7375612.1 putative small secreted protein [Rhodoferax ferrireducens]